MTSSTSEKNRNELAILRKKLHELLKAEPKPARAGALLDPENNAIINARTFGSLHPDKTTAMAQSMLPDGSWADIDYSTGELKDWSAGTHLSRLIIMGHAWLSRESENKTGNPELLSAILKGLDCWYGKNLVNPNWWWNQIGAPMLLGEILLCIKDSCDDSYIARAVPSFRCHQPVMRFTGQNMIWAAGIEITHGLLTDDNELVKQAFALIRREVRVLPEEEGIQPDMSFFQHGRVLYSGGYGQGFAADVARFIRLAEGTAFAFPKHTTKLFSRFLLEGGSWMIRGRTFDYGAAGREITRPDHSADRFIAGLKHLAHIEYPDRTDFEAILQKIESEHDSLVTGNKYFWAADFMTHHRPDYYISVRMTSSRIENNDWACCGGEGRLCHHMADGATFIMRDGNEYRDIFPAWNWRNIPGTTVEQREGKMDPAQLRGFGEKEFTGGASDGSVGCAGTDFSRNTLAARKAWFLFDNGMVALGAGISSSGKAPVRTTINQCLQRSDVFRAKEKSMLKAGMHNFSPGAEFLHDGFLYRIIDGNGEIRLGEQSGKWCDCGVGSSDTNTVPILNIGINHGINPRNASYAYAVFPEKNIPGENIIIPTRNDVEVQAVWNSETLTGQAVFYSAGQVEFPENRIIEVDKPCILICREETKTGRIVTTVSDPLRYEREITISFSGAFSGKTTVELPRHEYAGSSIRFAIEQVKKTRKTVDKKSKGK